MKICRKCGGAAGVWPKDQTICKECSNKAGLAYRARDLERLRAYDRERWNSAARQIQHKKAAENWAIRNADVLTEKCRTLRREEPEKYRARSAVSNAIRDGRLGRGQCEICCDWAHAHHEDYSKPLEVRWLCPKHHSEEHRKRA